MTIGRMDKKPREAKFFAGETRKRLGMAFADKVKTDFCLGVFLNAAKTVDFLLAANREGPRVFLLRLAKATEGPPADYDG